jgi:hypothetical protein
MEQYGLPFSIKHSVMANGGMMAKGGKITYKDTDGVERPISFVREHTKLMYFEPINNRIEIVGFINDNTKIVSPTGSYYLPNPIAKAVIKWAKKNGYQFEQDGQTYADGGMMAEGGVMAKGGKMADGGEKYEVLSPDGITIEFDKPYYTSRKKAYEAFDKWKKRYEAQGYYSSNNRRIPLDELENYMTIRELDGGKNLGMMKEKLPKHLEEKLAIIAKWNDVNIKDVIGFLNAMIDSGLTDDDLKTNPTKNTRFQRERATEKKIKEIWEKIEPNYKGRLKGNHYYGIIKEIISSGRLYSNDSGALLKDFKPYRNKF